LASTLLKLAYISNAEKAESLVLRALACEKEVVANPFAAFQDFVRDYDQARSWSEFWSLVKERLEGRRQSELRSLSRDLEEAAEPLEDSGRKKALEPLYAELERVAVLEGSQSQALGRWLIGMARFCQAYGFDRIVESASQQAIPVIE